jgi:hypothetical protein
MSDEEFIIFFFFGGLVVILNIVLFFKVWGMTNDVKALTRLQFIKEGIKNGYLTKAEIQDEVVMKEILRQRTGDLVGMERPTKPKTKEEIEIEEAEKINKKGVFQKFMIWAAKNEEN